MFADLLPGDVVVEETDGKDGEGALEEELALVADAATSRREEFAAGRACARRALQRLGVESGPLLVGENREPLWPEGVVGSLSHTSARCVAAVAAWPTGCALGVDVERHRELSAGVRERVLTAAERQWCMTRTDSMPWDLLVFSAKEAVYKAWFPLAGRWLGYRDAELSLSPDGPDHGRFEVEWLGREAAGVDPLGFAGRYAVTSQHIATAVVYGRHAL